MAEVDFPWTFGESFVLYLPVNSAQIIASVDGKAMFSVTVTERPLAGGGNGLVIEEGRMGVGAVRVCPCDGRVDRAASRHLVATHFATT